MPRKTAKSQRSIRQEAGKKRANIWILHDEQCELKTELGIVRKAIDSECGAEWYVHQLVDKLKIIDEKMEQLKKELDVLEKAVV